MSTTPKGPYTLVTVNNAPERAQRLIGRVVEIVKDRYVIKHVANAESKCQRRGAVDQSIFSSKKQKRSLTPHSGPEAAHAVLEQHKPDVVVRVSLPGCSIIIILSVASNIVTVYGIDVDS